MIEIERLLERLAEELRLPHLPEKDQQGSYALILEPSYKIELTPLDPGIFMSSPIGPYPKEGNQEALLIYLMKANLLGQGTGGASLGLNADETLLTLSRSLPFEVSFKEFHDALEDFLNYIDYWKEEIQKLQASFK